MNSPTTLPIVLVGIDDLVIETHPSPTGGLTVRSGGGDVLAVLPDLTPGEDPASQYAILQAVAGRGYTVVYDPSASPSSVRHRVVIYDEETRRAMFTMGGTLYTYRLGGGILPEYGTADRSTGELTLGLVTITPGQVDEDEAAEIYGLGAA